MRVARALAAASLAIGLVAAGAPAAQADLDPPADGYGACQFTQGKFFDKFEGSSTIAAVMSGADCVTIKK